MTNEKRREVNMNRAAKREFSDGLVLVERWKIENRIDVLERGIDERKKRMSESDEKGYHYNWAMIRAHENELAFLKSLLSENNRLRID
jgi:hypothetical protein